MNTTTDWGVTRDYFENIWSGNTIGTFKVPSSIAKRHNLTSITEDEREAVMDKLFDAIATNAINALIATGPGKILRRIRFEWLKPGHREILMSGVCEFVQDSVLNRNVWQRSNAGQVQASSYQINSDTVSWLLASDTFNQFAKNLIQNSKIENYQVHNEEEAELFITTASGNIEIIGWFDDENIQELI